MILFFRNFLYFYSVVYANNLNYVTIFVALNGEGNQPYHIGDKAKDVMSANRQILEQQLIGLYANMLSFAQTLTLNKQDANDLTQETTLKALSNLDKYYDNVNFKGWVFTIMHNLFINRCRHAVRSQALIDQSTSLFIANVPHYKGVDCPEGAYSLLEITQLIDSFDDNYSRSYETAVRYSQKSNLLHKEKITRYIKR